MPNVLVTGSNRGLGIEWVRQYAEEGWRVFATCRHPAEANKLNELAAKHEALTIHRMDVTRRTAPVVYQMEKEPVTASPSPQRRGHEG